MHVPELRQLRAEVQPLPLSFILVILEAVKLQQQSRWYSHKLKEACINTMCIELYGFPYIKSLRFGLKFVTYHSLGRIDYEKIQQISIPTLFHHQTLAPCCLLQLCVHGILQARILKWVAIPFFRGSSPLRDQTWVSCIAGRLFTFWAIREALNKQKLPFYP